MDLKLIQIDRKYNDSQFTPRIYKMAAYLMQLSHPMFAAEYALKQVYIAAKNIGQANDNNPQLVHARRVYAEAQGAFDRALAASTLQEKAAYAAAALLIQRPGRQN